MGGGKKHGPQARMEGGDMRLKDGVVKLGRVVFRLSEVECVHIPEKTPPRLEVMFTSGNSIEIFSGKGDDRWEWLSKLSGWMESPDDGY